MHQNQNQKVPQSENNDYIQLNSTVVTQRYTSGQYSRSSSTTRRDLAVRVFHILRFETCGSFMNLLNFERPWETTALSRNSDRLCSPLCAFCRLQTAAHRRCILLSSINSVSLSDRKELFYLKLCSLLRAASRRWPCGTRW